MIKVKKKPSAVLTSAFPDGSSVQKDLSKEFTGAAYGPAGSVGPAGPPGAVGPMGPPGADGVDGASAEPHAEVSFGSGITLSTGANTFGSVRFDLHVSLPCAPELIDKIFDFELKWVDARLSGLVADVKKTYGI